ncbi:hypothetical protein [Chryseobacterium rhizosphaerae]|uniref:Uncharacterized protein n=1 Tax=Chryseobacterium rhizosphaerae TaxID=395937 RepID=A0ABX9IFH5_9FLAO|nr:hypothetical protein [Chryseobacterium rhizosphaerae]REC71149.1 hypothetical protein DRF57_21025 [Chryseobacterium rhizosphaerae]GEN67621.1 hypothetical protein CRH01_21890 [Chryseobacterium rhizosphaerae]
MKGVAKQEYTKVKIEGILNLKKLSGEYELTPEELVGFHNQYCSLQELLTLSLPKYVEYIYIPSDKFEIRDRKLLKSAVLEIPSISSEKVYGVIIRFLPKDLQIHYKIKVKRTASQIELTKEKTYVNNQGIDKMIEQLFEKAEQILYPLQISIKNNGGLDNIINHEEIAKRWKTESLKLKDYYQSETTDQLLEQMETVYTDINLKKDWFDMSIFYKLFFLPVYQGYPQFQKKDFLQIYFSGLSQEIGYNTECILSREYTRGNKIAVQLAGMEEETPFNKNGKKGEASLLYKLNKETRELFSITGSLSTFEGSTEYKIEFQLFEQ